MRINSVALQSTTQNGRIRRKKFPSAPFSPALRRHCTHALAWLATNVTLWHPHAIQNNMIWRMDTTRTTCQACKNAVDRSLAIRRSKILQSHLRSVEWQFGHGKSSTLMWRSIRIEESAKLKLCAKAWTKSKRWRQKKNLTRFQCRVKGLSAWSQESLLRRSEAR